MSTSGLRIERADERHLLALAPLFAAYRRFYGRADDPRAQEFLVYNYRLAPPAAPEPRG